MKTGDGTRYYITGTDSGLLHWENLCMHNANLALMAIEMACNRLNFAKLHVIFTMYYGLIYTIFSLFWYEVPLVLEF